MSCHPGRQAVLVDEWQRLCPTWPACVLGDGWVQVRVPPPKVRATGPVTADETLPPRGASLAFATQVWPDATPLEAPSINAWAKMIAQCAIDAVLGQTPWRLHLFGHDIGDCAVNQRRLGLIEAGIFSYLKQKQRRLCKSCVQLADAPWDEETVMVNVGFTSATKAWLSIITPDVQSLWRHSLSRFAGGFVPVIDDARPPARAYRKLREALAHIRFSPSAGQTWVDLGAAPGSWSFDAVEAGAQIWAIDRSVLRADLMDAANLQFVKADAFSFRPVDPVDILVCDVIAYPERSIALLETWLRDALCDAFVVTLKFRGADDYVKVDACKKVLERYAASFILRQLYHNKNEVTAAGFRKTSFETQVPSD